MDIPQGHNSGNQFKPMSLSNHSFTLPAMIPAI